ncbi:MAG: type IX secretion system outer membrane channel protein PorV [Paludibacter sp.]|nr:type IX secretion system outer membrane channel protein PorV [Paludibacter sp.]
MKKIIFSLVIVLVSSSYLFSQGNPQWTDMDLPNPVLTGVPALSITPDARGGGMGDVGAATRPDENSQYWNPAKYAFMESEAGFSVSYTPWLRKLVNDINLGYVAGYWRFSERNTISASLRYFSLGDLQLTDANGLFLNTIKPYEMAIDAAWSLLLSEKFSGAVALRYIRSDLNQGVNATSGNDMHAGNAFAADIAFFYNTPITFGSEDGRLRAGLNISNIGSKISYQEGVNYFIPTNLRLGASLDYPMDEYNKISISADVNKLLVPSVPRPYTIKNEDGTTTIVNPSENGSLDNYYNTSSIAGIFKSFSDEPAGFKGELREIMWSAGVEYAYNNQFFVRAGYFNENKLKGNRKFFTAGLGFKLNVFALDAGYVISVAQQNPLDQTLRISLSFDLNGIKNLSN